MTTQGDYSSLPGTVEELAAEAERALLEQGGSDHPDAHTYAAQAGAAMRSFFEPWFDVPDPAGAADVDEEMKAQPAAMVRYSHDMDDAAGVLDRAGSVVQDALSDSTYDLWSRQGVGMAPTAGMYEYRACLASVSELIEQTAVNTRDAAAHLRKVAALFVEPTRGCAERWTSSAGTNDASSGGSRRRRPPRPRSGLADDRRTSPVPA